VHPVNQLNLPGTVLIIFFIALNIYSFFIVYFDKKKAIYHRWRVSERKLFLLALAGGAIGIFLGMKAFRHKTKHFLFTHGIPLLMMLNIVIFYLLIINSFNILLFLFS